MGKALLIHKNMWKSSFNVESEPTVTLKLILWLQKDHKT